MHVSAAVLLLLFTLTVADATCYRADGVAGDSEWKACDTEADVSHCCSVNDYCLPNGLCLDASGDNGYTIQGCTDADWSKPCQLYCNTTSLDPGGYIRIWLCLLGGTNAGQYCCGSNPACCEDFSNYITSIPLFTSVYKARAAMTSTSFTSTTSAAVSSTVATSFTNSPTSTIPSEPANSSSHENRNLAIGLGVGIPLGLFLVAALSFLGFQMRKRNSILSAPNYQTTNQQFEQQMGQPTMSYMGQDQSPQPKDSYVLRPQISPQTLPQQFPELSDNAIAELPQHPHLPG